LTELNEGDVEVDGYVLGAKHPVFIESLDPGFASSRVQDVDNPVGDNRTFGRDFLTGPAWTLELVVNELDAAGALATVGALAAVWRADKVRATPGAESVLRYRLGGRTRRVYGRTRRFAYTPDGVASGVIQVTADFTTSDTYHYDDAERTVAVRLVPPTTGGFIAPFTAPVVTVSTGDAQGIISAVGGDTAAPFAVTFQGPVTNPKLVGDGWEIELRATIPYDRSVTVDTRRKTVLRDDGANLAGALTHRSRLASARLDPGPEHVVFSGVDATGTASAVLRWRPTYIGL
jgi:hypothetical protein